MQQFAYTKIKEYEKPVYMIMNATYIKNIQQIPRNVMKNCSMME